MKKAASAILGCLEEKKMSQRQLAARMGEDVRHLNQQLNRQSDMKVERFTDVLDHIGYRVEVVENGGIQKVCEDFANSIIENREPKGLFWYQIGEVFVGIDNQHFSEPKTAEFQNKEMCWQWLLEQCQ